MLKFHRICQIYEKGKILTRICRNEPCWKIKRNTIFEINLILYLLVIIGRRPPSPVKPPQQCRRHASGRIDASGTGCKMKEIRREICKWKIEKCKKAAEEGKNSPGSRRADAPDAAKTYRKWLWMMLKRSWASLQGSGRGLGQDRWA